MPEVRSVLDALARESAHSTTLQDRIAIIDVVNRIFWELAGREAISQSRHYSIESARRSAKIIRLGSYCKNRRGNIRSTLSAHKDPSQRRINTFAGERGHVQGYPT